MTRVFISYSRKDSDFALRLVDDLTQNRVSVWFDQTDIPIGKEWDEAIEEALSKADYFLLIISKYSVESRNVLDEFSYALDKKKKIIPILINDCEPPMRMRRLQYTDFRGFYETAFARLLAFLPDDDFEGKTLAGNKAIIDNIPPEILANYHKQLNTKDTSQLDNELIDEIGHAYVYMLEDSKRGERWEIMKNRTVVGRHKKCDIVIADLEISRKHFHILKKGDGYQIKDLQSMNGTWLQDHRLDKEQSIKDGDIIMIASKFRLQFVFPSDIDDEVYNDDDQTHPRLPPLPVK